MAHRFKVVRRSEASAGTAIAAGTTVINATGTTSRAEVVLRPVDENDTPIPDLSDSVLYFTSLEGVPALNEVLVLPF